MRGPQKKFEPDRLSRYGKQDKQSKSIFTNYINIR